MEDSHIVEYLLAGLNVLMLTNFAWIWQTRARLERLIGVIHADITGIKASLLVNESRMQSVESRKIPPDIVVLRLTTLEEDIKSIQARLEVLSGSHPHRGES